MNAPPAASALLDARYRLGPVIARGGMSIVYRGTDTRLDRPVAIKVMDPRMAADPAFRMRFEREARSAARIDHPAVVDVHDQGDDIGPDGPVLFLVMELVEGATLRNVLRDRGPLGVPAALAVMEPVLAGLAEAHRLGLVHRDVKPENVLISENHEVKVADFGLATAAAQAGASHAGMIMGTVAYLSPEQVATGNADPRSDVYAAGVLLYELLTGTPPYTGDTAISVAYRHVNNDMPAPSLIAGDVPPELDRFVLRATSRDPAARPADAAAMLAELRQVAQLLEVPRVPPPVPPRRPLEEQDTMPGVAVHPAAPPGRTGTRMMERPDVEEVEHAPHLRARLRSRRVFALWIALVLVVALLVGVTAWYLGSGRWTAMPSVVGLEREAALQLIADANLVATITETPDDGIAEGVVAAANPQPEAQLLRGASVALTVSTGRPTVPDIAPGTPFAAAEKAIREAKLSPERGEKRDREYSATVAEGAVVRTDPPAGSKLPVGGTVTIITSRGAPPDEIEVPDVVGSSFDDAERELERLGLKAERVSTIFGGIFGGGGNRVRDQNPSEGEEVEPGTTVTLVVG
ncbi:Stk1 family PASTA domain-containing Ser/Thr kinase [Pseudonocardia sp. TRM90224]|uniref:Stk1 family PASTA domain-containing Ser/Thr kinase n=1 Tax=Pseudonocardia sp. TRM90224 TaxID=2812678 RepID=UPI001E55A4FC|nr:Stk1 family PASTA domain-containing Ser/Thr kinase [Pseudonocardia sp. TRM90224]